MSEFFLDFRVRADRNPQLIRNQLQDNGAYTFTEFDLEKFLLVVARSDDPNIWSPFREIESNVIVALVGRIAFDEETWREAEQLRGEGGLACKALYCLYRKGSQDALASLNGNFVAVVSDPKNQCIFVVTDRAGAMPIFRNKAAGGVGPTLSSHPDLLASATGKSSDLDTASFAEFLSTGRLSFPFTYYRSIEGVPSGSILKYDFANNGSLTQRRYFDFNYAPSSRGELFLAERLCNAFQKSIKKRTNPRFGATAVALSGGLDSRTILACCPKSSLITCVSFFDSENYEHKVAKSIAAALGFEFIPLRREFDHYGKSAAQAVRVSGAMGSLANNHFLNFQKKFEELGISNILTGFYCDYLFKGLPQDVVRHRVFRTERLKPFSLQSYRPLSRFNTRLGNEAWHRFEGSFPVSIRDYGDANNRLRVENIRTFPLAYEPDNMQSIVAQKTLPWFLPIADNDIIDVYLQIPASMKPNAAMYTKMVKLATGQALAEIPDTNTGAPVGAGPIRRTFGVYTNALKDRFKRMVKSEIATSGSWPNWCFYVTNSQIVRELWERDNAVAVGLFSEILGYDPYLKTLSDWADRDLELFLRLLTLKIWLDVRIGK